MQTVYGILQDNGDGSSACLWIKDKAIVDKYLDEDFDPERFGINEGCPAETLTFPDDLDLEACGFDFYEDDEDED